MTEQGVMPETGTMWGGSANDQQSLLKHAAGTRRDEGNMKSALLQSVELLSSMWKGICIKVPQVIYLSILNGKKSMSVLFYVKFELMNYKQRNLATA